MTDRELIELAAKAAGYSTRHKWNAERLEMEPAVISLVIHDDGVLAHTAWNPLESDADAFRLAVKLRIDCEYAAGDEGPVICKYWIYGPCELTEEINGDPYAATRRAITRAAAEIGKAMEADK